MSGFPAFEKGRRARAEITERQRRGLEGISSNLCSFGV